MNDSYVLFVVLTLISSCGQKKSSPENVPNQSNYTYISKNIIIPKCASCHEHAATFNTYAGLISSTDRVKPGDAGKSDLYLKVLSDEMPQTGDPLSDSEKESIKTWIDNGAKND